MERSLFAILSWQNPKPFTLGKGRGQCLKLLGCARMINVSVNLKLSDVLYEKHMPHVQVTQNL